MAYSHWSEPGPGTNELNETARKLVHYIFEPGQGLTHSSLLLWSSARLSPGSSQREYTIRAEVSVVLNLRS